MSKVDKIEKEKRIYQVSLLLRRKPVKYIIQFITEKWGITERQAHNYIRLARKEWQKYFANIKSSGIGYHIAQLRDLKDMAYNKEDGRLVLDIIKEEAKLMGAYANEKYKIEVEGKMETKLPEEQMNEIIQLAFKAISGKGLSPGYKKKDKE